MDANANLLPFFDTHTHAHYAMQKLGVTDFAQYAATVQKAQGDHVKLDGVVNVWCETAELMPGQSESHGQLLSQEGVWGAFGLHPHNAKDWSDELERGLRESLKHPKCVALGECGLDFHYNLSPHEKQVEVFRTQCAMAVELKLPLIVHSREAEKETVAVLRDVMPKDWRIHIHCFTSSVAMAQELLQLFPENLFIGFTGVLTFKNSVDVQEVVKSLPLNKILLETDAPFMAPAPHRGKTCHSGLAWHTAQKICELKGVSTQDGFPQLRENAKKMYGV